MKMFLLIYLYSLHFLGCGRFNSCFLVPGFHWSAFLLLTSMEGPASTKPLFRLCAPKKVINFWFVIFSRMEAKVHLSFVFRNPVTWQNSYIFCIFITVTIHPYLSIYTLEEIVRNSNILFELSRVSAGKSRTDNISPVTNGLEERSLSTKKYCSTAKPWVHDSNLQFGKNIGWH